MIKRIAPVAGAFALACAALIGCSDSSVSPTDAPMATVDPYVSLSIDAGSLNSFSELPSSVDEVMNDPLFLPPPPPDSLHPRDCDTLHRGGGPPPPDSLRHGGPGPDSLRGGGGPGRGPGNPPPPPPHDSLHHGGPGPDSLHGRGPGNPPPPPPHDSLHQGGGRGPDTTHHHDLRDTSGGLCPVPLGGIIRQLGLSAEQDAQIRLIIATQRQEMSRAGAAYKAARLQLFEGLQTTLRGIRAGLDAGSITRDQAALQIKAANDAYRASVARIEASYRAALTAAQQKFDAAVRAQLTAEQITKWDALTRH